METFFYTEFVLNFFPPTLETFFLIYIGFADGRIVVHNIKYDKTIITFQQAEGVVTSLSFRTGKNLILFASISNDVMLLYNQHFHGNNFVETSAC